MKKVIAIVLIGLALAVGLTSGIFIGKTGVLADSFFWTGTANGIATIEGSAVTLLPQGLQVSPSSVGEDYYPNGYMFDLKNLKVGEETSIAVYVRNNTKAKVNVYPVITSTSNVDARSPISNSIISPKGWTQFIFLIKAVDIGPCSINIAFKNVE